MKVLVFAAALASAVPVFALPAAAEAQVLTGRGRQTSAPRRPRPPARPPALTPEEEAELFDAEAELVEIDARLAEYQRLSDSGAITDETREYWRADHERRGALTAIIAALTAKRDERD